MTSLKHLSLGWHAQAGPFWVEMRLHEPHEEGGFGVTHNTVSRHAASLRPTPGLLLSWALLTALLNRWLPGDDLQDPATWDAPPL